jgi:hypothetical protein
MLLPRGVLLLAMLGTAQIALAKSVDQPDVATGKALDERKGETDAHLLATGDWSEIVRDSDAHATWALRGRLLVYDDRDPSASNHARVYLELQNVFEGGWSLPLEIYFNTGDVPSQSPPSGLLFEMRDAQGKPVPSEEFRLFGGPVPYPHHVVLPCDSTIRLRVDGYILGRTDKAFGLEIFGGGGDWVVRPNATFFLSATLFAKGHPAPFQGHVWQGMLHLPAVKIPVNAKTLYSWPPDEPTGLLERKGDKIVDAPPEDLTVARTYHSFQEKGHVTDGQRITILTSKLEYKIGEPVRVIHVLETIEPGIKVYMLGPKPIAGEYVDGNLVGQKGPLRIKKGGMVVDRPIANFNYDTTTYTFSSPGPHTILWMGYGGVDDDNPLGSNMIVINVVK